MKSEPLKRLGDYIRQVDVRNKDLSVEKLLGVSISKEFIPSIANTIGTDMSNYKIVKQKQFAYGPVTSRNGEKVSIALYGEEGDCIISQAYTVFESIDSSELLPDYLMMWFRRPEFDRYARFHSHGSAREIFDWDEMCEVRLPIPSIAEQRRIVSEYETVGRRIHANRQLILRLEETAQALYRHTFIEGIDKQNLPEGWRMGTLGEFGQVITGKTPSSECPKDFGNVMPFVTPGDFSTYKKFAIGAERCLSEAGINKLKNKILPKGSVIVTCIGSDMGKIVLASEDCITNQQMNSINVSHNRYSDYLYYTLLSKSKELKAMALGSSTMPLLNKSDFERIKICVPSNDILESFSLMLQPLNRYILLALQETQLLTSLQTLLLSRMGRDKGKVALCTQ